MRLIKVDHSDWNKVAESVHAACFNEDRPAKLNTFDYALAAEKDDGSPIAYATIKEMDKCTAYMQHGGAFPASQKSIDAVRAYHLIVNNLRENYHRATTRIRNTNLAMIKLAFSAGFIITGVDCFDDEIYLQLKNDFGG